MRSIRGIDAALRRIARHLGGEERVFFLAFGPEGETLEEILIREAERGGQRMEQIDSACVIWVGPDGSYTDVQWWYAADYVFDKAQQKAIWQQMAKLTPEDNERIQRWATERRQDAARRAMEIQQRSAAAGATHDMAD